MAEHHPFGVTGRAGRVDHYRQLFFTLFVNRTLLDVCQLSYRKFSYHIRLADFTPVTLCMGHCFR